MSFDKHSKIKDILSNLEEITGINQKEELKEVLRNKGLTINDTDSISDMITKINNILISKGNALPEDVIQGKTFSNKDSNTLTGIATIESIIEKEYPNGSLFDNMDISIQAVDIGKLATDYANIFVNLELNSIGLVSFTGSVANIINMYDYNMIFQYSINLGDNIYFYKYGLWTGNNIWIIVRDSSNNSYLRKYNKTQLQYSIPLDSGIEVGFFNHYNNNIYAIFSNTICQIVKINDDNGVITILESMPLNKKIAYFKLIKNSEKYFYGWYWSNANPAHLYFNYNNNDIDIDTLSNVSSILSDDLYIYITSVASGRIKVYSIGSFDMIQDTKIYYGNMNGGFNGPSDLAAGARTIYNKRIYFSNDGANARGTQFFVVNPFSSFYYTFTVMQYDSSFDPISKIIKMANDMIIIVRNYDFPHPYVYKITSTLQK